MPSHVIAIDGPSASGKSSTAGAVARALGYAHLDSGALYRGVTLVALREAARLGKRKEDPLPVRDSETILRAAEARGLMLQPDGAGFAIYLNGEPVDEAIRGPEVTAHVSALSAEPVIREWVNRELRTVVRAGSDVVVDGRDIGTVVFPEAQLKVFLTASPRTRALRRLEQRGEAADPVRLEEETARLAARDQADTSRAVAPLRPAPDAVLIDGTSLSFEQQVDRIVAFARARGIGGRG